jgi:hypothetical protein
VLLLNNNHNFFFYSKALHLDFPHKNNILLGDANPMYLFAAVFDEQLTSDKNLVLPLDSASVNGAIAKLTEKIIQLDRNGLLPGENVGLFWQEKMRFRFAGFEAKEVRKYYIKSDGLEYFRSYIVAPLIREIAIPTGRSYWIRCVCE